MKKIESKVLKTNIIPAVVGINEKKKNPDPSLKLPSIVPTGTERIRNLYRAYGLQKILTEFVN